jgi:hypothetical protein
MIHVGDDITVGAGDRFPGNAFHENDVACTPNGCGQGLVAFRLPGPFEEHIKADHPGTAVGESVDQPGVKAPRPAFGRSDCPKARAERESRVIITTSGGEGAFPAGRTATPVRLHAPDLRRESRRVIIASSEAITSPRRVLSGRCTGCLRSALSSER